MIQLEASYGANLGHEKLHYGLVGGGANSGFQALNMAFLMGFNHILLLGYDMQGDHFFGNHPEELNRPSYYDKMIECFNTINTKSLGITVLNCSRQSRLECFPKVDLDKALEML